MSDDLVKRLRDLASLEARAMPPSWKGQYDLYSGSADRIEELEAKLAKTLADRDAMLEAAYRMALEDAAERIRPQIARSGNGVVVAALHGAADDLLTLTPPDDLAEKVGK